MGPSAHRLAGWLFVSILLFVRPAAWSACSSPAGVEGQLQWINADSKFKFCDGTSWLDTSVTTGASCSGTTGGTLTYASGELRYCNGSNWIGMKGSSLGSCSGTGAGVYNFNTGTYRFCDGTNWYRMRNSTPVSIDSSTVARTSGAVLKNVDLTSASFTPPSNSIVVVAINAFTWNNELNDIEVSISDSGSHLWHPLGKRDPKSIGIGTGNEGHASLFFAFIPTSAAMTVSVRRTLSTTNNSEFISFKPYIITGIDPNLPILVTGAGDELSTNNSSPTTYTSSQNNSRGIMVATDANALGLPSSTDDEEAFHQASTLSGMSAVKASATATAGTNVTFNIDAFGTGTPKWHWVAAEILPEMTWPTVAGFRIRGPIRCSGVRADNVDLTCPGFVAPDNSLLLVMVNADTGASPNSPTYSVTDSGALTWTMAAKADYSVTSVSGHASIWWAKVATGGTARHVSVKRTTDSTGGDTISAHVYVITGHDTTNPIGNVNKGGTTATNNLSAAAFNASVNGSLTFGTATDWNALGAPTTTDVGIASHFPGIISTISVYKSSVTATSGTAVTLNFDAAGTTAPEWNWAAVEIRPAP